jgi:multidrug efflux system outer membrane protein
MKNMTRIVCLSLGVLACLGGCTLAPEYTRPGAPIPGQWPSGAAYAASQPTRGPADATQPKWREFFSDRKLQRVIEVALDNNRDLRVAGLNVQRAIGLYDIQRAQLLPIINGGASYTRQKTPANIAGFTSPTLTFSQFGANVLLSAWEIDFFGRIQSLAARALEEYLATEQARRSAQILLVSQVGVSYLALAADQENLKLAKTTLETQLGAYDLVKRRLDRGLVPDLDLQRAQTQVDAARVDVARWTQFVAQDKNALDLLAGATVPDDLLATELGNIGALKELSPGISSELLLSRPDIMQAEDTLKGANANIGAARAAFFPRISLTSSVGSGSSELSALFKTGSMAWSFGPQIVMPIFDPRTWGALTVTEVEKKTAVAQYEKAIQTAFREVADALAVRGTVDTEISAQESLVRASGETYRLSTARYVKGVDNYLSVLDAQQSLYTAQRNLVLLRLSKVANQVKLYAVLGGGWQSDPAPTSTSNPSR